MHTKIATYLIIIFQMSSPRHNYLLLLLTLPTQLTLYRVQQTYITWKIQEQVRYQVRVCLTGSCFYNISYGTVSSPRSVSRLSRHSTYLPTNFRREKLQKFLVTILTSDNGVFLTESISRICKFPIWKNILNNRSKDLHKKITDSAHRFDHINWQGF